MFELIPNYLASTASMLIAGLFATLAMVAFLAGCQQTGLSRVNLPFLFGTMFAEHRARAMAAGYAFVFVGGWAFGFLYALVLDLIGTHAWWAGALLGAANGVFLVTVVLPYLPNIHPRMASEYSGPTSTRRLQPPGAFGLNYGRGTPAVAVAAQIVYGAIFALLYRGSW